MPERYLTALPVFNEAKFVNSVLDEVLRYSSEVLVVNDGSTDGTTDLLNKRDDVRVLDHPENRGYGAALRSAFQFAAGNGFDVVVTIDCDGQHQPRLIREIADLVDAPENPVDMVSGSRYLQKFEDNSDAPEDRRVHLAPR